MASFKYLIDSKIFGDCYRIEMIIESRLRVDTNGCLIHYRLSIKLMSNIVGNWSLKVFAEYTELFLGILFHVLFYLPRPLNCQMLGNFGGQSFFDTNELVRIITVDVNHLTLIEFFLWDFQLRANSVQIVFKFIIYSPIIIKNSLNIRLQVVDHLWVIHW